MAAITDETEKSFRLNMLIYDTRYRSLTIQVVALIGFMLLVGWLVSNMFINLEAQGKELGFGFLDTPAGYDISQRLINYNSQSMHWEAALVGLLNTLLVAFLGCIAATIIGVFVGVMRLSKNWLIARLMTIYVEMFRNVPVLLWIVFAMAIFIESLPKPKEFRGDEAEATMSLFGSTAVSNQGVFIPRPMFGDYAWVLFLVLVLSYLAVRWVRQRADSIQQRTGDRPGTFLISTAIFVIPVMIAYFAVSSVTTQAPQSFVAVNIKDASSVSNLSKDGGKVDYCHSGGSAASLMALQMLEAEEVKFRRKQYFSPSAAQDALLNGRCNLIAVPAEKAIEVAQSVKNTLGEEASIVILESDLKQGRAVEVEFPKMAEEGIARFEGGLMLRNSLIALWLALSLYTAAYIAEIVRAGILSVSRGQSEAASALGLRPNRTMRLVILPQALRVIIPPLISNYLNLTKNSSLAIAVGYMDITGTLGGITMNQTGREMECILILMLIYLAISLTVSAVMNWYNNSIKLKER
ncbi:amino acid ABC transporter permease [Halovulum sp. GXIMD14793]